MLDRRHTLPKTLAAALRKQAPRFVKVGGDDPCTTIASYNVHKCVGTDGRFDPGRTAAVVAELDADIVALQDAGLPRAGARASPGRRCRAAACGMRGS